MAELRNVISFGAVGGSGAPEHPCAACDYSLRGLRGGDRCPECGEVITTDEVIFYDRASLRRLGRGWRYLAGAVIVLPLFWVNFDILADLHRLNWRSLMVDGLVGVWMFVASYFPDLILRAFPADRLHVRVDGYWVRTASGRRKLTWRKGEVIVVRTPYRRRKAAILGRGLMPEFAFSTSTQDVDRAVEAVTTLFARQPQSDQPKVEKWTLPGPVVESASR